MGNQITQYIIEPLVFKHVENYIARPSLSFESSPPPPAPDYNQAKNWCDTSPTSLVEMKPDNENASNNVHVPSQDRPCDVFFIHPTTYFGTDWNGAIDDPKCIEQLQFVLAGQISIFNNQCRIHVPRYRQATLASFIYDQINGRKALDLAYTDIKNAFQIFLKRNLNQNGSRRPFFLASHSQGGWLMARLLEEEIENATDPSIRLHMVTCYCIGSRLPLDKFTRSFRSLKPSNSKQIKKRRRSNVVCKLSLCHYTSCNYRENTFLDLVPILMSSISS